MSAHKIDRTKCLGDCQTCWDFCKKFSSMPRGNVVPDCNADRGCVTARDVFFGRDDKEKNRVQFGSRKLLRKFDVRFPEKPEFRGDNCTVVWKFPETGRNSILNRHSKLEQNDADIVFILFGRDLEDRWYEIGQTLSLEMKILPEVASKMSEIRLMGVASTGVVDESSVAPSECRSTQQTVLSR